jgi:hypothetical protein
MRLVSSARKGTVDTVVSARRITGSSRSPVPSSSRASCLATPGSPPDASHRAWHSAASSPPSAAPRSSSLRPPSRSSCRSPSGPAAVTITASGAAAHRTASTESIPTASGPPRSTSSTTISRGEPDTRCLAAVSSCRGSAAPRSKPATTPAGAPASRSSCAQARRPGRPSRGDAQSTSNPRRRASAAAASAIRVLPDPFGPEIASTPPALRAARSSRRPISLISRRRPATSTPPVYRRRARGTDQRTAAADAML